ncbi:protein FAM3D [Hyla sarda]|uniref:protein FAM3D n=1 Tax=Hyla sarda TaxID=327740 RepID=UPI0024C3BFA6|nr:protein FAM3D [Hyla sarda]XP_056380468.1 protein FAM3D [Hyla sarda]XP_056380469.1 protein FAM3D [Hyla sarda]
MRWIGIIRILVIVFTLLSTWFFVEKIFSSKWEASSLHSLFEKEVKRDTIPEKKHRKCGNDKECPQNYFAFKVISGAANVVGPSICLEDKILMSNVRNNIGRGLNIALVNASTTRLIKTGHFDMYSGDVKDVQKFLAGMKEGTLIFIASFDDPATKLDDKTRDLFTSYGSSYAKKLGFRDSWTFVGGKGLKNKSPFEQHIKNDKENNKYDGWPEVLEISGCIPKKMD